MKYIYFIKWCAKGIVENIKSWDVWMWGWMITCAWGPTAIMNKDNLPNSYYAFILFVFVFWFGYGLVYTGIKRAYNRFQEEQNKILDHLSQ